MKDNTTKGLHAWLTALVLFFGCTTTALAEEQSNPDEWQLGGEVYFWAASIGGETVTGGDVDIGIKDLIKKLDMAFMGAFAAKKGKWTFATDAIYLFVSSDNDNDLTLPIGPGVDITGETKVKLKSWIVSPTVRYNLVDNEKVSLNLLGGLRYLWMDAEVKVRLTGPLGDQRAELSGSGSNWDGIIGVNGDIALSEKWYVPYYVDIGTGDSDFTWQAYTGVGYHFKRWDAVLGYRYMAWDFDKDDVFDDMNLSGIIMGAKFWF